MAKVIILTHGSFRDGRTGVLFDERTVTREDGTRALLGVAEVTDGEMLDKYYRNNEAFQVIDDDKPLSNAPAPNAAGGGRTPADDPNPDNLGTDDEQYPKGSDGSDVALNITENQRAREMSKEDEMAPTQDGVVATENGTPSTPMLEAARSKGSVMQSEGHEKWYDRTELEKLTVAMLKDIAKTEGIEVDENEKTKKPIIDAIIAAGESDPEHPVNPDAPGTYPGTAPNPHVI